MEEQQGVNVEAETTTVPPTENNEQETIVTEDVQKPVSNVQENLKIALQKERERRRAAEEQLRTQTQYQAPMEEDETVKRFLNVEATTLINNKILTDPSFKDRADLVQAEMRASGKNIEDADNAVIARLFKEMTSVQDQEQIINKPPQQIKPTAIPEERQVISKEVQSELDMFDAMAKSFGK